jgi:hypothetical protein
MREIAPSFTPSARTLAERLERFVSSTTQKLAARMTATPHRHVHRTKSGLTSKPGGGRRLPA